jgi:hypothetical protein
MSGIKITAGNNVRQWYGTSAVFQYWTTDLANEIRLHISAEIWKNWHLFPIKSHLLTLESNMI